MSEEKSLNRQIAEALSYRTKKAQKRTNYWVLIRPDGSSSERLYDTEAAAWTDAPDYEHSLDAVVDALPADYASLLVQSADGNKFIAEIFKMHPRYIRWFGEGATRQEAAACALLAWAQAQPAVADRDEAETAR